MSGLDITLAVCVRDDAAALRDLVRGARRARLFRRILVVDDGSQQPVRLRGARVIRHDRPRGIGAARNTAIDAVATEYLLFVDSDDRILPELAHLLDDLAGAGRFDLCLFRHVDSRVAARGRWGQTEADEKLWQAAGAAVGHLRAAGPEVRPTLARTVNYPWNKVWRTAFLRDQAIRCPEVAVHEDMALHWLGLARAGRVLTSDRACLWHGVDPAGARLTNRRDATRLHLFAAAAPVVAGLRQADAPWREAFLRGMLDLADWAATILPADLRPRLRAAEAEWLRNLADEWQLPGDDPLILPRLAPPAPALRRGARLAVAAFGAHAGRMPLAYPALQPLWRDRIRLVRAAREADLLLIAHPQDAGALPQGDWGRPLALLSEEPFWDSLFSPDPLAETVGLDGRWLHQLNHHRSGIFAFDRIPYFLLTDHRFAAAYGQRFARNARVSAADWREILAVRKGATFLAERRVEAFHDLEIPAGDILGLCARRTRLAEAVAGARRLGASWQGGAGRLDLADWHMDKLVRLDGRSRLISAIENTHQPRYISEKVFDAFACGAVPIYVASPGHHLHRIGLPEGSWLNLFGLDEAAAARAVEGWQPTADAAQQFAGAQARLAALFGTPGNWLAERRRLAHAVVADLERIEALGPATSGPATSGPAGPPLRAVPAKAA